MLGSDTNLNSLVFCDLIPCSMGGNLFIFHILKILLSLSIILSLMYDGTVFTPLPDEMKY